MTYVKIDQFDQPDGESTLPFRAERVLDRSIRKISRLGGYVVLFAVVSVFIIGGAAFF